MCEGEFIGNFVREIEKNNFGNSLTLPDCNSKIKSNKANKNAKNANAVKASVQPELKKRALK